MVFVFVKKSKQEAKAKLFQLNHTPIPSLRPLVNKKMEIEKTKPTFNISVLKVEY